MDIFPRHADIGVGLNPLQQHFAYESARSIPPIWRVASSSEATRIPLINPRRNLEAAPDETPVEHQDGVPEKGRSSRV